MSLRGSLRTMPVEDVLDWIDRRFACGTLTVERGAATRSFHFDSGYVTRTDSNHPAEQLGHQLRVRGLVTADQLAEAFRVQADTGVRLGKILLMVGAVDAATLDRTLHALIREAVADTLAWPDGVFAFEPDVGSRAASEYAVSVNLRDAIEAGRERAPRWRAIETALGDDEGARLWLVRRDAVGDAAADLVAAVDEGKTIGDIVRARPHFRFDTLDALARLVESGAAAIDRRRPSRPAALASAADVARAARGRAAGGDRVGALELVMAALAESPDDEDLNALRAEIERSVFAELSRSLLSSFRVPKLLKTKEELSAIDMTQAEKDMADRIDGRWDLLSLMRISPLRDVDALLAIKRLADRGIISL